MNPQERREFLSGWTAGAHLVADLASSSWTTRDDAENVLALQAAILAPLAHDSAKAQGTIAALVVAVAT